jgi:hypothetical protein
MTQRRQIDIDTELEEELDSDSEEEVREEGKAKGYKGSPLDWIKALVDRIISQPILLQMDKTNPATPKGHQQTQQREQQQQQQQQSQFGKEFFEQVRLQFI